MIQNWQSKDGTVRLIDDMDEDHVRNCINLVSRSLGRKTLLKLIMTAYFAEKKKINVRREMAVLNGDMAQQFNDIHEVDELQEEMDYLEEKYSLRQ